MTDITIRAEGLWIFTPSNEHFNGYFCLYAESKDRARMLLARLGAFCCLLT